MELAPFFPGNMDGTVGISNHTTVDPVLGSLSDIEDLTAKLHNRGNCSISPSLNVFVLDSVQCIRINILEKTELKISLPE